MGSGLGIVDVNRFILVEPTTNRGPCARRESAPSWREPTAARADDSPGRMEKVCFVGIAERGMAHGAARKLRRKPERRDDAPTGGQSILDRAIGLGTGNPIEDVHDRVIEVGIRLLSREAQRELSDRGSGSEPA